MFRTWHRCQAPFKASSIRLHRRWRLFPEEICSHVAGTAGCVLAKRLSTSPSSILVLERGQLGDSFVSRIPLLSLAYNRNDDGVLKYNSSPQRHLHDNRSMQVIGGKLLGGTSRVNNGLYTRCQPAEFQDWGEGWDWVKAEELYNRGEGNPQNSASNGEWQTRIVEPFFESSKMYFTPLQRLMKDFSIQLKEWECRLRTIRMIRSLLHISPNYERL